MANNTKANRPSDETQFEATANAPIVDNTAQRPPVRKPAQTDPIPSGNAGSLKVTTDPAMAAAHAAARAADAARLNKHGTGILSQLSSAIAELAAAPSAAPRSARGARPGAGPVPSPYYLSLPVLDRAVLRSAGETWQSIEPGRITIAPSLNCPARPIPAQRPQEEAQPRKGEAARMDAESLAAWQERRLRAATALYSLHILSASLMTHAQLTVSSLAAIVASLEITEERQAVLKELGRRLNSPLTISPEGVITTTRELMPVAVHAQFAQIAAEIISEHRKIGARPDLVAIKRQEWAKVKAARQRDQLASKLGGTPRTKNGAGKGISALADLMGAI
jgi:hypothetical protein